MYSGNPAAFLAEALVRAGEYRPGHQAAEAPELSSRASAWTIALSREVGAGGTTVAREVGARMGWPVYDHKLLECIAGDLHVGVKLLEDVDEGKGSWFWECLQSLGSGPAVTETSYVRQLIKMLLALGARGECIIVGRGAAQLLPKLTTLRVRLVASWEDRVAAIARERGLSHADAESYVSNSDRQRIQFVRDHFRQDPVDPQNYDLVLNSSRFSIAACTEMVLEALHRLQAGSTLQILAAAAL